MRLRFYDRVSDWRPRDKAADAAEVPVAVFGPGHSAQQHPEGMRIHGPDGHVATLTGRYMVKAGDDGQLGVFAKPRTCRDSPASVNQRNAALWSGKPDDVATEATGFAARQNRINEAFYRPKKEE